MLGLLLSAALALPTSERPTFTEADIAAATACADGPNGGSCAPFTARAGVGQCMTGLPPGTTGAAFSDCIEEITHRCVQRWTVTGDAMDRRVVIICSEQTRAAVRGGIDDWYVRVAPRIPAQTLTQYRDLEKDIPARVARERAQITDGPTAASARAGATLGVWASLARFFWDQERQRFPA